MMMSSVWTSEESKKQMNTEDEDGSDGGSQGQGYLSQETIILLMIMK